jgi:hypothetical protein
VAPRDLHTQRLAGYLATHCHGFRSAHPGRFCDVLQRSHLRLRDWTGRQLVSALDATMRERSWYWPDRIVNPAGFLAFRLAQLPVSPPACVSTPIPPQWVGLPKCVPASPETRAAVMDQIRTILSRRRPA